MTSEEIKRLIDSYFKWLKDKTYTRNINDVWTEITTPFIDRHNDYLQIYAKKENDIITLTDDGYIINDLINSGCPIDSSRRKELLNSVLVGFGVNIMDNELFVKTDANTFPMKKQDLLQAMLTVNDMFFTSSVTVKNLFIDDVENWINTINGSYFSDFKLTGKSGYNHSFNFAIPKSKNKPERIIQTINNPNKDSIGQVVFKWLDTKENRRENSELIVFMNDINKSISDVPNIALAKYGAKTILWTEREKSRELLTA